MRRLCVMWRYCHRLVPTPFLLQARGLLRYARFAPNHTDWPQYEALVTEAIRAVQARRLAPPEALQFVTTRLCQQLHNQVCIVE